MQDLNNTVLPYHPVAEAFPMMAGAEFDLFVEDIRAHGLREPIWLDGEGRILDGRNRERACRLVGVPLETRTYEDDDVLDFVISLNLHRRHLSESQRAMIAARMANIKFGEIGRGGSKEGQICTSSAAALLNVSERSAKTARSVRDHGAPPLVAAVDSGLAAVSDAAAVVDLPAEEQEALVAAVKSGKHKTLRRAAVARRREKRETPPADMPAHDGRVRLFTADVAGMADRIEAGSIDCIITDPPYPRGFLPVYEDLARTAAHVLKPGASCLVMVGQSYLPEILAAMTAHLRYHWTVAYLTPGGQSVQLGERKVNTFWKPVLWFVNDPDDKGYLGDWVGDVARSDPNDNDKRFHHWGQSESGMADLVRRFTSAGETVFDPFLGGGTTGVVALGLNRLFVGADIDGDIVEQARGRLLETLKEVPHAG
jgi:ParB-like chromosome segregation protein Spo0J